MVIWIYFYIKSVYLLEITDHYLEEDEAPKPEKISYRLIGVLKSCPF